MNTSGPDAAATPRASHATLVALAALLAAEGLLALGFAVAQLFALLAPGPVSLPTGIGLFVLALLATGWAVLTVAGALRARHWVRSSAITWQVLQLAVAVGCLQGLYLTRVFGWVLLAACVAGVVLAVLPVTARALGVADEDDVDDTARG